MNSITASLLCISYRESSDKARAIFRPVDWLSDMAYCKWVRHPESHRQCLRRRSTMVLNEYPSSIAFSVPKLVARGVYLYSAVQGECQKHSLMTRLQQPKNRRGKGGGSCEMYSSAVIQKGNTMPEEIQMIIMSDEEKKK